MGFGKWKPQEPSIQSQEFQKNQRVSFIYRKQSFVGEIEKLLVNSAIVSLSLRSSSALLEKTVINYKNLLTV